MTLKQEIKQRLTRNIWQKILGQSQKSPLSVSSGQSSSADISFGCDIFKTIFVWSMVSHDTHVQECIVNIYGSSLNTNLDGQSMS